MTVASLLERLRKNRTARVSDGREVGSDHYAYKLDWFDALAAAVAAGPAEVALCGDMNVAPADADVFGPAAYLRPPPLSERGHGGGAGPDSEQPP